MKKLKELNLNVGRSPADYPGTSTKFPIGFKKNLFKTTENTRITIATKIAVLIINIFLSSIAAFISFEFSDIKIYPTFSSFSITFLIVVKSYLS